MTRQSATAFAPASVANVAIGFDILGFSVDALGDRVTATRSPTPGVRVKAIRGAEVELPLEAERNTAGKAVMVMCEAQGVDFGIDLEIDKGIPLSSGLGGSAASAVAAVVAANALLPQPLDKIELLKYAMQGEAVASGSIHADNISPSLFGGLVLTVGIDHPRVKQIPVPPQVRAVIAHPHMYVSTKQARAILAHGQPVGLRVADGQPRRFHFRLLHQRHRHDPRLVPGRGDRAAAATADPRVCRHP